MPQQKTRSALPPRVLRLIRRISSGALIPERDYEKLDKAERSLRSCNEASIYAYWFIQRRVPGALANTEAEWQRRLATGEASMPREQR